MRYIFNINRNKIYVYKGVFLLLWLRLVIHGDNIADNYDDITV